jgi:hypothetical protein
VVPGVNHDKVWEALRAGKPVGLKKAIVVSDGLEQWDPLADAASDFALNLRHLVQVRGFSIRQLADETGISEKALHDLLAQRRFPSFPTLVLLAEILKGHCCVG